MKKRNNKTFMDKLKGFFANLKDEFMMLSTAQKVVVSAVSGLLLVAIVGGVIVIAVFSGDSEPAPSESDSSDPTSASDSVQDNYDPDEFIIETVDNPYILAETEEAGEDYLLNSMLIGDSNTVGFASFLPLENVVGIEGMGIQSVASHRGVYYIGSDTAQTIPYAIAAQQPQRVYISFGTNNLVGVSSEQFITQYENAIAAILEAWEYCDIIVVTIPPIAQGTTNPNVNQKTIDQFNLELVTMVEENDWKLLNTTEVLKGDNGYIKSEYVASDGYHLVSAGHEAILDYINTHTFETEDRRPQPLDTQPKRANPPAVEEEPDDSDSSSSSQVGVATAGEIEKLKLAVTNGKTKLTESASSATGDGSDLSAGDVARSWVPKTVYDALDTAIKAGEALIAATNPLATEVITAEATINANIKIFDQNKKTEVTLTEEQKAKNTLTALVATAKTTLASATATDQAAADIEVSATKYVPTAIYNLLATSITEAEAIIAKTTPTITELNDITTKLTNANGSFQSSTFTGTKPAGPTEAELLATAKSDLSAAITAANTAQGSYGALPVSADGGLTDTSGAAIAASTQYMPQAAANNFTAALAAANGDISTLNSTGVRQLVTNLTTATAAYVPATSPAAPAPEGG